MKSKFTPIIIALFFTPLFSQWEQSSGTEGLDMQAVISMGETSFAGGQTGTYKSTNDAESFYSSNTGNDDNGPTRGFTYDNQYIYTCTSQGVFRSSDNGESWIPKNTGLNNLLSHGIINTGSLLVHVGPGGVSISNNQGENWVPAGLTGTDVRCVTHIQDTLFVGTNGQGLYKSTDWGSSWTAINNGSSSSNFRAIESKGNTLFAGGQNGTGVFRSTNFGHSWELLSNGIASSSFRGFAHNNDLIVAGSTGAGVFYSIDNGDSWTEINSGLTDFTIFDLSLSNNHIVAATHNQGVFRFNLSNISLSVMDSHPVTRSFELHQNYPNPFNPVTTIKFDIPKRVPVQIKIYDMVGHEIKTLVNAQQNPGVNSVVWDATNYHGEPVSAGMYLVRVSAGNYQKSQKMVLLK